jgi:hypothetical protein
MIYQITLFFKETGSGIASERILLVAVKRCNQLLKQGLGIGAVVLPVLDNRKELYNSSRYPSLNH